MISVFIYSFQTGNSNSITDELFAKHFNSHMLSFAITVLKAKTSEKLRF